MSSEQSRAWYRIGSLFSGAGGLDIAVEAVFGGRVVWHSEIDPAASKVLAHHWPDVPNLGDITQVDWATVEPVDVLCGGFPCQDVSAAGKRAGLAEGTRSGLWAMFAEVINQLRPGVVVIENVRGLLSAKAHRAMESEEATVGDGADEPVLRALGAVLGDLSDLGYDAQWITLAASAVGAPHKRERVFILATDTTCLGCDRGTREDTKPQRRCQCSGRRDIDRCGDAAAHTACNGRHEGRPEPARIVGGSDAAERGHGHVDLLPTPMSRDHKGRNQRDDDTCLAGALLREMSTDWGKYAPAIHRWETVVGPAPAPTEPNRNGNPRLSAAFSEWLMGWPAGWVTDPTIGISRNDQLRIIGNGVVPQQAIAALNLLLGIADERGMSDEEIARRDAEVREVYARRLIR